MLCDSLYPSLSLSLHSPSLSLFLSLSSEQKQGSNKEGTISSHHFCTYCLSLTNQKSSFLTVFTAMFTENQRD